MKLDTEFIKLPLRFDVEQLKREIAQFTEDDWMPHATGFPGNFSIPLISLNGEYNDALHGAMKGTPALARCAYIQQIMTEFGEVFSRSRLMRLEPGTDVPPHVDVNYHWHNRVRIHVPITTTEDVLFYCNDKHVHMAPGECWIFNSWQEHTVQNNSDRTRVHLVLDTAGSPRFWQLAEEGEWPFENRSIEPTPPKYIAFDPDQEINVRTEAFNAPLVLCPAEIESLAFSLVEDASLSADSDPRSVEQYRWLARNFVRAWREVWSEHGMKPTGWPLYHALVNQADAGLAAITPEIVLNSNEVELGPAFRGLVLYSAINEEFAPQYLDKDELPDNLEPAIRQFKPNEGGLKKTAQANSAPRRNDPCHCGSGKRFKHCHGSL